ncbi:UNVERIFIED_CONTAM: hypothetical protein Slati_1394200 [Sesamum latifolium]|uniref:Uncharacterized protein n=1 Tax=Sesamum latifolium TaxID=2727402 RepID=A0AAW2X3D5_9LAMI
MMKFCRVLGSVLILLRDANLSHEQSGSFGSYIPETTLPTNPGHYSALDVQRVTMTEHGWVNRKNCRALLSRLREVFQWTWGRCYFLSEYGLLHAQKLQWGIEVVGGNGLLDVEFQRGNE